MHIAPSYLRLWGPQVNESYTWIHDPKSGAPQLDSLVATSKTYVGSSINTIMLGHLLDSFIQTLGDFEYVSTTAGIIYPVATVIRETKDGNNADKADSTIEVTSPDHVAFTGKLKSGAIANVIMRGGIKATEGRRHFIWEIDGEDGSIRIEGKYRYRGTTFGAAVLIDTCRNRYIRYSRLQRPFEWEACTGA